MQKDKAEALGVTKGAISHMKFRGLLIQMDQEARFIYPGYSPTRYAMRQADIQNFVL